MAKKRRYRIFFELFLLSQSSDSLEILKFIREPLIPFSVDGTWKWTYWFHGKEIKIVRNNLSDIIMDVSKTKFNHAWFSRPQSPFNIPNIICEQENFYADYFPSPTSVFWDVVSNYRLRSGDPEDIRRVYQNREAIVRTNEINVQPSLLIFDILVQSDLSPDDLLKQIIPVVVSCFDGITVSTPFIGGIDIQKYNPKLYAYGDGITKLEFWPFTYPMIGKWLDRLRPINIASRFLCDGIRKVLDLSDTYFMSIPSAGLANDMAIVQIPLSIFDEEEQIEKLNRFVVPCDATTERVTFDQSRGEFITESGEPIFTLRRYRQKFPLPPSIAAGSDLFLILPEKYCRMLNIDVEDMAVFVMEKNWRKEFEKELDKCFDSFAHVTDLHERVWKMYFTATQKKHFNVCYLDLIRGFILKSKLIQ
jgi:hypothetical protein